MIEVGVTLDTEPLQRALREAPEMVLDEMRATMEGATLRLERAVAKGTPVDRGRARGSVSSEVEVRGQTVLGIVAMGAEHGLYLEFGSRAGRRWPPEAPIRDWVRRKGLHLRGGTRVKVKPGRGTRGPDPEKVLTQITFLIRRAIGRRGSREFAMFRNAWRETGPVIQGMFDAMMGRIAARLGGG